MRDQLNTRDHFITRDIYALLDLDALAQVERQLSRWVTCFESTPPDPTAAPGLELLKAEVATVQDVIQAKKALGFKVRR